MIDLETGSMRVCAPGGGSPGGLFAVPPISPLITC